jgi:hypothetical protein
MKRALAAEAENARVQTEIDEWKDAIIDACVVDWIFTTEHKTNPRKAVNDLLCWQQRIALDPAVSKDAAEWQARIEKAESQLVALRLALAGIREELEGLAEAMRLEVNDFATWPNHKAYSDGKASTARYVAAKLAHLEQEQHS